ncbi:MAG: hypothetical protein QMC62_11735 [Alteromonadaceae bacterium]
MKHQDIWDDFCEQNNVAKHAVPLFEASPSLEVATHQVGKTNKRHVLSRSAEMELLIISQTELLILDKQNTNSVYDGLIYLMFYIEEGDVKPLYIGKTESQGRKNNISANIKNIKTNKSNFARWGDNYQYHIGDLSAVVIPGHPLKESKLKYLDWADTLFHEYPSYQPKLNKPVYFWCQAWKRNNIGIWRDFGETRLTFLEYLLIGVASSTFPELLLNREGQSRC